MMGTSLDKIDPELRFLVEEGHLSEDECINFQMQTDEEIFDDDYEDDEDDDLYVQQLVSTSITNNKYSIKQIEKYLNGCFDILDNLKNTTENITLFGITEETMHLVNQSNNLFQTLNLSNIQTEDYHNTDVINMNKEKLILALEEEKASIGSKIKAGFKSIIDRIIRFFKDYFTWIGRAKVFIKKRIDSGKFVEEEVFADKKVKLPYMFFSNLASEHLKILSKKLISLDDTVKSLINDGDASKMDDVNLDEVTELFKKASYDTKTIKETTYGSKKMTVENVKNLITEFYKTLDVFEKRTKAPFFLKRAVGKKFKDDAEFKKVYDKIMSISKKYAEILKILKKYFIVIRIFLNDVIASDKLKDKKVKMFFPVMF